MKRKRQPNAVGVFVLNTNKKFKKTNIIWSNCLEGNFLK